MKHPWRSLDNIQPLRRTLSAQVRDWAKKSKLPKIARGSRIQHPLSRRSHFKVNYWISLMDITSSFNSYAKDSNIAKGPNTFKVNINKS